VAQGVNIGAVAGLNWRLPGPKLKVTIK
jgi:hypothetical protein